MLRLVPITLKKARIYVEMNHRHNIAPQGGLFAIGVEKDGELCGVAITGRPVARALDDGSTCEVTRLATNGERNVCSKLYSACASAARSMGYSKIITYTLETEPGTSLVASGWRKVSDIGARPTWSTPTRPRHQQDMFGSERRPSCAKSRWERLL